MIEPALVTVLNTVTDGRVFPDTAPLGTVKPYITYQQVGGNPVNFLGQESSDKKNSRIQINVWSSTRAEANTLMRHIEDLMVLAPLNGSIEGALIAARDVPTDSYGAHQDFSFWA